VCPLEANWVTAGFAAPGEGQEEPQEAGSQERKHASRWIRHASHQPWKGIRNIT